MKATANMPQDRFWRFEGCRWQTAHEDEVLAHLGFEPVARDLAPGGVTFRAHLPPGPRMDPGQRADDEPQPARRVETMVNLKSVALALGATGALTVAVALGSAPAFAQNDPNGADAYMAGVDLGRTLHNSRQCGGGGDYHQGCVDGVLESQFDREADQALSSGTFDAKPSGNTPLLSPPPGLVQDPSGKPSDSQPPND